MRDSFNNIIQKFNEYNILIEDVLNTFSDTPKNYKLKKKIEAAFRIVKRTMQRHEDMITDAMPPIKSKKNDYPNEFIEIWNIYKDFLIEQFGIRMKSRMQLFRLKLLFELTENDFIKAGKWLKYYMAAGSSSIYPVNDFKIEQTEIKNEGKKAGFTIPGKK
ncbi:MAG: hypothetical protein H8D45_23895 [Bacteroidetes bacterium]|nr:hypothetical protein [Bacteroidota bacterium]MBL7105802.1 hypothetical protein [Bacteroidales bacterium]